MARVLILYWTVEGQCGRIAERMAARLAAGGHSAHLERAAPGSAPDFTAFDAVIVGASVHYGRHPGFLARCLRAARDELANRQGAFFSVSLSAGGPGAKPVAAQRYLRRFLSQAGWEPAFATTFGGALQYSKYGPIKRRVMQVFMRLAGGATDPLHDYEYTDWEAVERFAERFAASLPSRLASVR